MALGMTPYLMFDGTAAEAMTYEAIAPRLGGLRSPGRGSLGPQQHLRPAQGQVRVERMFTADLTEQP